MVKRQTRQRTAIRAAFDGARRPLSPQEVLRLARPAVKRLGIATVYRTLSALVEEGLLIPIALPGQPPRYEPAGKGHHHHFQCRRCDRIYEVEACPGSVLLLAPKGFSVDGHDILLYGTCADCAQKPKVKS